MSRYIICENSSGETMQLGYWFPFWLAKIEGVREANFTITKNKAAGQDGETYTGSTADVRTITLQVQIKNNYTTNRNTLHDFFQPEEQCTLYYYEDAISRKINYHVESVYSPEEGIVRTSVITLLCADPYFEDIEETKVSLSAWKGNITFPLRIHNPFSVASKVNTLMMAIESTSSTTLGLRIRFTASGEVENPKLIDVTRQITTEAGLTMHDGDELEITTGKNNKNAYLTSDGITSNVINTITYPPKWVQLYRGDNLLRYDADSGLDSLSVDVFYRQKYWTC